MQYEALVRVVWLFYAASTGVDGGQNPRIVGGELMRLMEVALDGGVWLSDDPHLININYPAAFPDEYHRPEVRLEIGPLAS